MRILRLCLVVLAACGGGKARVGEDAAIDSAMIDAAIDAPIDARPDAMIDAAIDAPVILIDAPMADASSGVCNPLTQTGCNVGEKCNWIYDQLLPTVVGHIGCEPDGNLTADTACGPRAIGPEACVKGTECVTGVCKQICDPNGGSPSCDGNHACVRYQNLFDDGSVILAGVCDPGCDPLTQDSKIGPNLTACGSTSPTMPDKGCYGYNAFSCALVAPTVSLAVALTLTDRTTPAGNYVNGCAPGFSMLLFSETGSLTATCNGLCAALETDNTPAHAGNAKGDPAALAKLPTQPAPAAGDATCAIGKKGSETSSDCRFLWLYMIDDLGELDPAFLPLADTLGVCFARDHYRYDSNGDGQLTASDLTQPDCATLPPRSGLTPGNYDDAADFGCQLLAHSMFAGPAVSPGSIILGQSDAVPIRRHEFR